MKYLLSALLLSAAPAWAQTLPDTLGRPRLERLLPPPTEPATGKKPWYEAVSIRGYMQVRYNRLLETNSALKCEQCDKSWGENGGIFFRRIRLIVYGQLHPRVYFYLQPDFASTPGGSNTGQFAQLRDAYFDVGLDAQSRLRLRLGQSKIPYGFENMQSSQHRLPLDRNDALNSAVVNERDLGAFLYWAPVTVRRRFKALVDDGLKGSGDYGVLAFGVYNGQAANRPEQNNGLHVVARASYPLPLGRQIIEPGLQAYSGRYSMAKDQLTGGVKHNGTLSYPDERAAASLVLYPQPFGLQMEYNVGRGPEFNPATDSIEVRRLHGGYATASYRARVGGQQLYPFVRGQYYRGGKKYERDARSYRVRELEIGLEWQPVKYLELVPMYTISDRRFEDLQTRGNRQRGRLLRLQAQLNF
ncbi:OprO/OprP family phosphate-selective porin [Hymenobacter sp. 15J16-1T3B]|uniref:porin n=1 Tax=Hymenobacter sp. 15J16-1T3B TaxID=2886941 RepID=UPI001D124BA6|nr:porin [Hymenobacter sp. 15J16-1T3B]MCC3160796.1 OprO/OprP family phosphate-selective porin [Hymenobacter sp. 15J16-1T3B]